MSSSDRRESSALLEAKIVEELDNRHNLLVEKNREAPPKMDEMRLESGDFHEESVTVNID